MRDQRVLIDMPLAQHGAILSWDKGTIDELVNKAIDLTVKIGLRIDQDADGRYLGEARERGAGADAASGAVLFSRAQVEETIAVMRDTLPAPQPLRSRGAAESGRGGLVVGNGANLLFDWDAWQAKGPDRDELKELCRWAQGEEEVESLFAPVMVKDVNPLLEPLYNYALTCTYCRKRVWHEQPTEPIHVRYLQRMAKIVERHRGYFQPMQEWEYINPPFRIGLRAVRTMLERVDSGACPTMGIGSMSVAGMSAPVTVPGLAVTAAAEILAGLTFFRLMRPGHGLRANVCTGSLDLRTARVSYFGMHTHLGNLATWELLARGLGVDCPMLVWYRDANEPGLQALYEYGANGALFSALYSPGSHAEIGGLCNGNVFSPHQAVLDIEAIKEFRELQAGFALSEESLGLEEIVRARFEQGHHVTSEHTLNHMRDGAPISGFFLRGLPAAANHDKAHSQTAALLQEAAKRVEAAKEQGKASQPDRPLGEELSACVNEAAAELGLPVPDLP